MSALAGRGSERGDDGGRGLGSMQSAIRSNGGSVLKEAKLPYVSGKII